LIPIPAPRSGFSLSQTVRFSGYPDKRWRVFQLVGFCRRYCNGGKCFARDCVTQRTAVEINQTQVQLSRVASQEARQQFVGVTQT
jgi:hypothetical protein